MKVIDLLKKIDKAETMPKKIRVDGTIYTWSFEHFYYDEDGKDLLDLSRKYNTPQFLSMDVKLIEENQEIDIQSIEEIDTFYTKIEDSKDTRLEIVNLVDSYNEMLRAIKQLDRQIKEDK